MVTDIIHLGDKVDIRLVQQTEQVEKTGITPHIYASKVFDISTNGEIELLMPIENGKIVLLPLNIRFEFVFYTSNGLYRSVGQVIERYKKENCYVLLIELRSQLVKFQRREYFRYPCLMEVQYYNISEEEAQTKSTENIFNDLRDEEFYEKQHTGAIADLSGGGVRFLSDTKNEENSYILLIIRLCNDKMDKQYYILGHILTSVPLEGKTGKYENRVQFVFQDARIREEIIHYIFEEERKSRGKKKG